MNLAEDGLAKIPRNFWNEKKRNKKELQKSERNGLSDKVDLKKRNLYGLKKYFQTGLVKNLKREWENFGIKAFQDLLEVTFGSWLLGTVVQLRMIYLA